MMIYRQPLSFGREKKSNLFSFRNTVANNKARVISNRDLGKFQPNNLDCIGRNELWVAGSCGEVEAQNDWTENWCIYFMTSHP
jgi:hypothetical protein